MMARMSLFYRLIEGVCGIIADLCIAYPRVAWCALAAIIVFFVVVLVREFI